MVCREEEITEEKEKEEKGECREKTVTSMLLEWEKLVAWSLRCASEG